MKRLVLLAISTLVLLAPGVGSGSGGQAGVSTASGEWMLAHGRRHSGHRRYASWGSIWHCEVKGFVGEEHEYWRTFSARSVSKRVAARRAFERCSSTGATCTPARCGGG